MGWHGLQKDKLELRRREKMLFFYSFFKIVFSPLHSFYSNVLFLGPTSGHQLCVGGDLLRSCHHLSAELHPEPCYGNGQTLPGDGRRRKKEIVFYDYEKNAMKDTMEEADVKKIF